jgi:Flp pilus assembly protein TadG
MQPPEVVSAGARRPGPRPVRRRAAGAWRRDDGAVSVEAAFGIAALVAVMGALAWCFSLLGAQLAVGEAARAAARVAARGDDASAVRAEARRLVGDAEVVVHVDADHVVVEVSRSVAPPGALARWGGVHLHADATALVEETP